MCQRSIEIESDPTQAMGNMLKLEKNEMNVIY